jgi:hypothetical protein
MSGVDAGVVVAAVWVVGAALVGVDVTLVLL